MTPPPTRSWSRVQQGVLLLLLVIGMVSRVLYVGRPLDHRLLAPWREADYVQVARNFYRDGLNIFFPQIDWRGDTPGYAEMEFPLLPWVSAVLDRFFGYHEQFLRALSSIFSVLSLFIFVALSQRMLPPAGALFATAAFALNPLLVALGNAMQPEPLMLFLSLLAIVSIVGWEEDPRFATLFAATGVIACAILAKSPAAHLILILAYVVLRKLGVGALADFRAYGTAALALLPPFAWYLWAQHFWRIYGNSLGVSNESHFFGWDMLLPPRFLFGILKWETLTVFTPAGWLLALAALRGPRSRIQLLLIWYGAVWVFYLVSARTSGDDWAFYYHSISVAPACLLMGAGLAAFNDAAVLRGLVRLQPWQRWAGGLLAIGTLAAFIAVTLYLIHRRDSRGDYLEMRRCALDFVPYVPPNEKIVVHGGTMVDEYGMPVAHNESMIFAWMDRQGFSYGTQELGVETLERIATRGGRYWIVQRGELERDRLKELVSSRYRRIASCGDSYDLYDLHARAQ